MNNKKRKRKKEKKEILYRTKEERQQEVKTIIEQLSVLNLDIKYEPIKKLYRLFKTYISDGNRMIVNIPFPEIKRRIKGLLSISVNEESWLKLEKE